MKQVGPTQLTMQIMTNGVWGDVIDNSGSNVDSKNINQDVCKKL